jgi:methionyl aminopeptidase
MVNLGTHHTKVLADGWTVVTLDGKPSAHAEHTIAITEEGPEVLTRVALQSPSATAGTTSR